MEKANVQYMETGKLVLLSFYDIECAGVRRVLVIGCLEGGIRPLNTLLTASPLTTLEKREWGDRWI
jgi:hypothetical protein